MIYGYLRVSTDDQDINSQKQGVDSFAQNMNLSINEYITDEGISGGKDPKKRNLGPLLAKLNSGDIIIASEISRLGRDLYMVMDILHHCMKVGCVIYTVKDKFTLGNDIQSKVLAFAFGLSAEIERQMIRQRTTEGLKMRVKMGVLVGRPPKSASTLNGRSLNDKKEDVIQQFNWGVPLMRMAKNFGVNRGTISRALAEWGINEGGGKWVINAKEKLKKEAEETRMMKYKDDDFKVVNVNREQMILLIEQNLTIPQIAEKFPSYTYEQIYDTILCDYEYNNLYRNHGQLILTKKRR